MSYYLVKAEPTGDLEELKKKLDNGDIEKLNPFGDALTYSLIHAKYDSKKNQAIWEEEDYCSPPLRMEREQILNHYFTDIEWREVQKEEGWREIKNYPSLWDFY